MKAVIFVFLVLAVVLGCANEPTYTAQLEARPHPTGALKIQKECGWIRGEIARMHSLAVAATTSTYAVYFQAVAAQNIAALETRADILNCTAAFSQKLHLPSKIQQCIDACKTNTDRPSRQCFDICNK